jgi:hypothetical protein
MENAKHPQSADHQALIQCQLQHGGGRGTKQQVENQPLMAASQRP